jgi:hypothetical protein
MLLRENGCDALKGTSLSRRSAPPAGNPFANTVSESEANDQSDCNFKHRGARTTLPSGPCSGARRAQLGEIPLIMQWDKNFDIGADTGTPAADDF